MDIILKPFAMLLMFLYDFFNSYGLALILFGFIVKIVLFPVTLKSKKSMIQMNMLSGRMNQLKAQYGKDPQRYNMEVQKLYEKENVNPMGGCVWSLIPMFVLIGLYGIIREPLTNMMGLPKDMISVVSQITGIANEGAYPQIAMVEAMNNPATLEAVKAAVGAAGDGLKGMNFSFLGMDLASIPSWKFWSNGVSGILTFVMVLVSAAVGIPLLMPAEPAQQAQISSDGVLIRTVSLNVDQEFTVPCGSGFNTVTVRDGRIAVTEADCPDHYCMDRGFCSGGSPIVCLPNKLVIEFLGPQEIDGILG